MNRNVRGYVSSAAILALLAMGTCGLMSESKPVTSADDINPAVIPNLTTAETKAMTTYTTTCTTANITVTTADTTAAITEIPIEPELVTEEVEPVVEEVYDEYFEVNNNESSSLEEPVHYEEIPQEITEEVAPESQPEEKPIEYVSAEGYDYILNVPNEDGYCDSNCKTFMGYQAVTNTRSEQYKLLNGESAYTDMSTGLRMVDGRYCIALGSYYTTTIGQKIDLVMEDGHIVPCILGDAKADCHTNYTHQYGSRHGDVAEFIIDNTVYYNVYDRSGTVNWVSGLSGKIISVMLVD